MSKMTDEQIIKALKHCYEHKSCNDCVGCLGAEECILNVDPAGDIYPIINRQQAEIEELRSTHPKCNFQVYQDIFNETENKIKSKAIKEFEVKIHEKLHQAEMHGNFEPVVTREMFDSVVKEMVGEQE
jgi:hypothetical protein